MRQKEYKPLPEKHLWQLALHTGQCAELYCAKHTAFLMRWRQIIDRFRGMIVNLSICFLLIKPF